MSVEDGRPGLLTLEDEVCGFDQLSHDGDEGDLRGFAVVDQALGEGLERGVASAGGHGGDIEQASGPASSPGDEPLALVGARVSVAGGHADQGGGLAPAHGAQFGHAHDQAEGDDGPHARQGAHQVEAPRQVGPGVPARQTHDYTRHGTTTLFAALNILDGTVIGRNMKRHRHQEFIRFLDTIEAEVPRRKAIHAIVDNYATHKHPKVRQWLVRHPRWTFHFTPTSASWLNAVEGFFAKLTRQRLSRGVFRSVADLDAAIKRFVVETNHDPKPFVWTADPKRVLAAVRRGKQTLESLH